MKKYRKPQKNLTPIGTVIHNMQLVQHLEMVDFDSDRRREFLIECLYCGNIFTLINRYFLRATKNKCPAKRCF